MPYVKKKKEKLIYLVSFQVLFHLLQLDVHSFNLVCAAAFNDEGLESTGCCQMQVDIHQIGDDKDNKHERNM